MAAKVLFSYCHKDEDLRDQVEVQLSLLKRQSVIEAWHDRRIGAGVDWAATIDDHVEEDDIILLLVSADFIASDYCYDVEMKRAMERHEAGEAIVIPVILRACDWQGAPFGRLNATPPDGKAITQYPDRDQGLLEVAKAVRAAAGRVGPKGGAAPTPAPALILAGMVQEVAQRPTAGPRSSNLALAKTFTDRDKDLFRRQSFDYMALFFENSLAELAARNPGVEGDVRRIDADRFAAAVYKDGRAVARCMIFIGGHRGDGIAYSANEAISSNGYNEMLTVEADDRSLYLRGFSMGLGRSQREAKLTQEGASELYWAMLIEGLQPR